ncbi:hypothetical protein [Nonomuraea pusilla]|uniref:Uncharacterized protein n=1 Tax=Nonomuraea pusilla TaxID=46177 RepID=A0A1H7F7A5_9ACTN|nr:hypothetical protein [Nonomuraea pusilla]SEK22013.1 hypothetical protein SAMN05660976_00004 [Nonomuraea pusilla]
MTPHNPPDDQRTITARQRLVLVTVASVGALAMLLIIFVGLIEIGWAGMCGGDTCVGGWHVNLLKAALVLPPITALLFAYLCSFSRTGIVGRLLKTQVLAFSAAVIVWVFSAGALRYIEDLALFR